MDILLLNEEFKNEEFVDTYSSFIWREAYYGGDGDFELTMSKVDSDASSLSIGRILTHSETNRMCVIDTLEEEEDDEGVVMSTWKGIDFTRWVFSRRSVMRTLMPTYEWARSPHGSASIERFKGAVTRKNDFINPHFITSDTVEPFRNVAGTAPPEEAITGHLRVGNGAVAVTGVTADNATYRGFGYKMTRQRITNPVARQFTFSFSVSDLYLSPGGRVIVLMDFFNSQYQKISSMSIDSVPITEDGRYDMTTPLHSFAPSFYDVTFVVDNRLDPAYSAIEDCGATFHSPRLVEGAVGGDFFAGDSSYLMLNPERKFSGTPVDIMRTMIDVITRNNTDRPKDNIDVAVGIPPGLGGYSVTPKNPVPIENVDLYFGPMSLYDALLSVGETYDLGVSIMRNTETGQLYSWVHGGTDRTDHVTYDPETDTLNNPSSVQTARDYMSHAIVYGKYDYVITDASGSTTSHEEFSGYDREMLVVQATDVDLEHGTDELYSVLVQRGREALNDHQRISNIDGEVPSHAEYAYGEYFGLGSMVTVKNDNGGVAHMRVTEYIFVSDEEGIRSYPTLAKDRYIDPGTWEAQRPSELWNNAVGTWAER